MKHHTIGVSMLYGKFTAAVYDRGAPGRSWDCPYPVEDVESFKKALGEAVSNLKYTGKFISFVIEDEKLEHVFVQSPTLSKKDMRAFLERRVDQEKTFEGPAAYSYSTADSPKGGSAIILNVMEKAYLKGMMDTCFEMGLNPFQMFPLVTVVGKKAHKLLASAEEIGAVVAQAGGRLALVIARGDGSILFERFLNYEPSRPEDFERTGRELNRSILFAKQQFGVAAASVHFIGDFPDEFVQAIVGQVDLPLNRAEPEAGPAHIVADGLRIPARDVSNLVPHDVQTKPRRDMLVKISAVMIAILWLSSVAVGAFLEWAIQSKRGDLANAQDRFNVVAKDHDVWESKAIRFALIKTSIANFRKERKPPVPGWLLSWLGEATPDGLILKKVSAQREGAGWAIRIEGISEKEHSQAAEDLKLFEAALTAPPYYMTVTSGWREKWLDELMKGAAAENSKSEFIIAGMVK